MTLFESDPQYREKASIWRIFSTSVLFSALAAGRVWRWFAINIPMDLGTGGTFTSDIDVIARLHDYPNSHAWLYRTWEVKVSLLYKDGTARSLKAGKIRRTLTQLKAYREFGSPFVSLLDVYLLEAGFNDANAFPPPVLENSITAKLAELRKERFGYQLLPFGHGKDEEGDIGLFAIWNPESPLQRTLNLLPAEESGPQQPFSRLAEHLNDFFERPRSQGRNSVNSQIVFCRECRSLQLISMRSEWNCPTCKSDLIIQS